MGESTFATVLGDSILFGCAKTESTSTLTASSLRFLSKMSPLFDCRFSVFLCCFVAIFLSSGPIMICRWTALANMTAKRKRKKPVTAYTLSFRYDLGFFLGFI